MKIDPEYISNEDIDWQRQSQRTYAKLSLKISQTKTRTKKDKETNKNKDNKKTRTRTIKKHLWKSGLKISQSCNWVLNHRCLWCLNIFGVGKSPIMRQIFNPECFSKMQTQIILLNININLISEFVQNIFLQLLLKDGKENILKFSLTPNILNETSSVEACSIVCCFFLHSYTWQNFTCSRWQGLASLRQWWLDKCQPEDRHDQEMEKCHFIFTLPSVALWKLNGNTLGGWARVAVMPCK